MMTKFQAAITEQYNGKAAVHEAHKLLLEDYLRKGGEQLDMPGYKANELYLQTLHALRIFDVASATDRRGRRLPPPAQLVPRPPLPVQRTTLMVAASPSVLPCAHSPLHGRCP